MKNPNEIETQDHIDISAIMKRLADEEQEAIHWAKKLLRDNGYFVDNLWQTCDVTLNYECSEEEAHQVLQGAFDNPATYDQIWDSIKYEAEYMNLKKRE
jgi:hypothetical protein